MFAAWLTDLDPKRLGLKTLAAVLFAFVFGTVIALMLHSRNLGADGAALAAGDFGRFFTAHGLIMVFLVLVPAIPGVLGNAVLPAMVGARTTAEPRAAVAGFLLYLLGVAIVLAGALLGGLRGGWDYFAVVRDGGFGMVESLLTLGVAFVAAGGLFTGFNFIATIHRCRAPRLGWGDLPVFAWSLYAATLVQALATLVFVVGVVRLSAALESDPAAVDALRAQKVFWAFAHPFVAASLLPAFGVIGEAFSVYARRPVFGRPIVVIAYFVYGAVAFVSAGQHLLGAGIDPVDATVHSGLALMMAVPAVVVVISWLGTLFRGAIDVRPALLYAAFALLLTTVAGMAGLFVVAPGLGEHLRASLFAGAQFHYLWAGGVLFALLAGLHLWWPLLTGRRLAESRAAAGAWLAFVGFNLAFFPRFLLGADGAGLRELAAAADAGWLGTLSSAGSYLFVAGLALAVAVLIGSLRTGPAASANPWGAATPEWLPLDATTAVYDYDAVSVDG
jgi:cytochrome c oxidase subunit 1